MSKPSCKAELKAAQERIAELEAQLTAGERDCFPLQTLQDLVFENAPGGMAIIDDESTILVCNSEAARLVGYTSADLVGKTTSSLYWNAEDQQLLRNILDNRDSIARHELALRGRDNSKVWVMLNGKPFDFNGKNAVLITLSDISEQKKARQQLELDETRFEMLYTISEMIAQPEVEILDFALNAITQVTASQIGYIYFLSEDETQLTLHAWSKDVMDQCNVKGIPDVYLVDETGLWGDAIRRREPVITNDYQNLPNKRGYPEGHVHIINHLNIPVFDGDRIVFLAGVGNKDGDYTEDDVRQLRLVMNGTWRIIQRKRADAELKAAHGELEKKVRRRTTELESANEDLATLNMQLVKKDREREQARAALAESEQMFRALFENNHSVMLIIDPESGKLIDVNPAAVSYYGYPEEQLRSMTISDINVLTETEIVEEMRQAKKKKSQCFAFRHRLASGDVRDVEVYSSMVKVEQQPLLFSIVHDITERKQAEEAMLRYENVISSTPDLISLVDKEYVYRMVNASYLEHFDLARNEVVGKKIIDLVGAETFERISKPSIDLAMTGETVNVSTWIDFPKTGRRFMAIAYHLASGSSDEVKHVSITARDMTELKKSEEALQKAAKRLDLATDAGNIGIWDWDLITDELVWDRKMLELYKVNKSDFDNNYQAWRTRTHRDDLAETERLLAECIEQHKRFDTEFRIVWPNDEIRFIRAAATLQFDDNDVPIRMTGVNWDVTDRRHMEDKLRQLASTDPLTGASNRRHFMDRLTEEVDRCKRYNTSLVLLSMDIDHFKDINDSYGHPAGDVVLQDLVVLCTKTLRTTDHFGRVGGEEFLAALTQTGIVAGERTAERLRQLIENHIVKTHGHSIAYTISIGATEVRAEDKNIESILKRADEALYKAKNNGRNRVEVL